jgi:autotransporter-associated beta strand protein
VVSLVAGNLASATRAQAASFVYSPTSTTDSWSLGTNWNSTPVSGIDTILSFAADNTTPLPGSLVNTSVNDLVNFQLNQLDLSGLGATAAPAGTINITGNALTFTNNGTNDPVVNLFANNNTAGLTYNVSNALVLSNTLTFQGNGTAAFNFSGNISGANGLTKTGTSTMILSGNLSYGGTTTVSGGTLRVVKVLPGNNTPGAVVIGGGTLDVEVGATPGEWTASDIDNLRNNATFNTGAIVSLNIDPSISLNYASNITQSLTLVKNGNGTLTLSGTNGQTATNLSAGRLLISNTAGLGAGTLFLNGGTFDNTSGSAMTIANTINWTGNFAFDGTDNVTLGPILTNGNRIVTVKGKTLTMGAITSSNTGSLTKQGLGTLALTGATNVYGNTAINGGVLDLTTTGTLGSGTIALANGELNIAGSAAGARAVTGGTITLASGLDKITLTADPSQPTTFTASGLSRQLTGGATLAYASTLYRGTNLGGTPGNGVTNIFFATPPALNASGAGTGALNALAATDGVGVLNGDQAAVLRGALYDNNVTGNGIGWATYDPAVGVRALKPSEQTSTVAANKNVKLSLAAGTTSFVGAVVNTLQLDNTSGSAAVASFSGGAGVFAPVNGMLFSGNSPITLNDATISIGTGAPTSGYDMIVLSTNTAGATMGGMNLSAGTTRGFLFGGPGNITVNGNLLGVATQGGVAINGPGAVTINGQLSLSSTGLLINGGTMKIGASFAFQNTNAQRDFQIAAGGVLDLNGNNLNGPEALDNINGAGGTVTNSVSATNVTLTLSHLQDITSNRVFNGTIIGNMNVVLNTVNTAGTVTATQTFANTSSYTGFTTISSGTLLLGINNALPGTTTLSVNGGGTNVSALDLAGFNQSVAVLSGTGTGQSILNGAANTTSVLTVNGAGAGTYTGVIANNSGVGGIVALAKSGGGALTLTGTNTYSGGTTITGGLFRNNGSLASAGNAVNVSTAGTLGGTGSIAGPVSVASGGHIAPGVGVGAMTLANTFSLASGAQLDYEFNGAANDQIIANTASNGFTLNGGAFNLLQENTANAFANPGTYQLIQFAGNIQGTGLDSSWTTNSTTNPHVTDPQVFRSYQFGSAGGFLTLTITSTTTTATWSGTAGSNWAIAGAGGNWSGSAAPGSAGDTAIFPSTASTFTVALNGNRTLGALTLNSGTSYSITQGSSGTLFMDDSTSTATITDTNGNHLISAPMSLTSTTNASVANATDALTISGNIGGTAMLIKSGAGTLVLGGNNSHGGTIVNGGTVAISADNNLGNSPTAINAGALATSTSMATARAFQVGAANSTIDVEGTATYELDGNITNGATAGALNKTGPGTLLLNGNATNTGGVGVSAGTLQIGNGAATGSINGAPANIGAGGTLVINRTGSLSVGTLSGGGALNQLAGSTLSLPGNNTAYSGLITVNNATLSLGNTTSGVGSASVVLNSATLTQSVASSIYNGATTAGNYSSVTFNGNSTVDAGGLALNISGQLYGSGTITHIGTGTLALGASLASNTTFSNTFFGGTIVNNSGTLDIASRLAGSRNATFHLNAGGMVISEPQGGSVEIGYVDGPAPITLTGSSARLRIGDVGGTDSYGGNITGGSLGLAKFGTGTLILSGQNTFRNDGVTFSNNGNADQGDYKVVVSSGTLIAASSTTDQNTGPLGGTPVYDPTTGSSTFGSPVLVGTNNNLTSAALMLTGPVTVANDITISGGGATLSTPGYVLSMGGVSDASSTFSGKVLLQNNLTVSQVPTTGGHALNLTGGMFGVAATFGPNDTNTVAADNTGHQNVTFTGGGSINVSGVISDFDPNPTNYLGKHLVTLLGSPAAAGGIVSVTSAGGTTRLTGANAYSGSTTLAGGPLILGKSAQAPVLTGAGGGIINSGELILDYSGGGTDPALTVQSILSSGNGNNFQSGQIRTTNTADPNRAIGYLDDTAHSQVIIRNTFRGDANLDGVVNALDFNALATNFGTAGTKVWSQGDFNYSGAVDTTDFMLLSQNFGQTALPSSPLPAPVLGTLVPEPSMLSVLAISAVAIIGRRRRRNA